MHSKRTELFNTLENKRTEEMYIAAIEEDWQVLQDISQDKRSEAMCLTAIRQNWKALKFVPENICVEVVKAKYLEVLKKESGLNFEKEDERFFLSLPVKDRWFIISLISESSSVGK